MAVEVEVEVEMWCARWSVAICIMISWWHPASKIF